MEYSNSNQRDILIRKLKRMGIDVEDTGSEERKTSLADPEEEESGCCCLTICSGDGKDESSPEPNYTEFLKLHATMRFLYKYAEMMSLNMRLKDSTHLQTKIDEWRKAEGDDDDDGQSNQPDDGDDAIDSLVNTVKGTLVKIFLRRKIFG